MNDIELIRSKIYEIRGQQVMIDSDLAQLYGVETKALNQSVKRNIERFPEDFMFRLTKDEAALIKSHEGIINSRSQIVTLKQGQNLKYLPYAFTENGVAMLSSILRSKAAVEVNIRIMRIFTSTRKLIHANPVIMRISSLEQDFKELKQDLEEIFSDYNDINEDTRMQLEAINTALADLQAEIKPKKSKARNRIGFKTDN